MVNHSDDKKQLRCSFCNKTQDQVRKLIAGPKAKGVYICDECIEVCADIIAEEFEQYIDDAEMFNDMSTKLILSPPGFLSVNYFVN